MRLKAGLGAMKKTILVFAEKQAQFLNGPAHSPSLYQLRYPSSLAYTYLLTELSPS
jgi:hypothetical protein